MNFRYRVLFLYKVILEDFPIRYSRIKDIRCPLEIKLGPPTPSSPNFAKNSWFQNAGHGWSYSFDIFGIWNTMASGILGKTLK